MPGVDPWSPAAAFNLLLVGSPGEGKSLIASAIPGVLPRLSDAEKVELTRIYSARRLLARRLLEHDALVVTRRPMRRVHHTVSKAALVGGGSGVPTPGEITLAHHGVLFLDELAEFSRATIEALRQPLESGRITISRASASLEFPCQFSLVAAMNPCPCGYHGTDRCRCNEPEVRRYQKKLSGPLLDRIDLQVLLKPLTAEERFAEPEADVSPRLRKKVELAREMQSKRYSGLPIQLNAQMPGGHVRDYCSFSPAGFDAYRSVVEASSASTRTMDRMAKVARTIADLDQSQMLEPVHVQQAAQFVIGNVLAEAS